MQKLQFTWNALRDEDPFLVAGESPQDVLDAISWQGARSVKQVGLCSVVCLFFVCFVCVTGD